MSRKSNFKLYRVWDGIVQRCYNPKAKNYHMLMEHKTKVGLACHAHVVEIIKMVEAL